MTDNGHTSELERLVKLRDAGDLTPEEFEREKAKLLSAGGSPFYRRLWFVVLLTVLLLTFPVALIILLTGPVYRMKQGVRTPIGNTPRFIYAGALGLWLGAVIFNAATGPSVSERWRQSAVQDTKAPTNDTSQQQASDTTSAPEACDSSDAEDEIKDTIENNEGTTLVQVKLMDFGHPKELMYDKQANVRYCQADAVLNTGETPLSYKFFFGPSGKPMIDVKEGADAFGTFRMQILALQAAAAKRYDQSVAAARSAQSQSPDSGQDQSSPAQNSAAPQPSDQSASESDGAIGPGNTDIPDEIQQSPALTACLAKADGDGGSRADEGNCYEQELSLQDKQLNVTYSAVMASMPADRRTALRDAQREWIKKRDKECNSDTGVDTGNAGETATPACLIDMTIQRRLQLEQIQPVSAQPSSSSSPPSESQYTAYMNDRFGFSIQYPAQLLTMQRAPDNNDGRTFKSADGKVTILAYGHYLMDGETPQTIAKDAEANCPDHHASYEVVKQKLVAVSCQMSGTIKYQKTIISGDTAITLDASYPASEMASWNSVVGHMASSMHLGS